MYLMYETQWYMLFEINVTIAKRNTDMYTYIKFQWS